MKSLDLEKKILTWIQNNIWILFFIFVTLAGFLIRYHLRGIVSGDARNCLLPWYDKISEGGGIWALKHQVGDYNILYQTLIAIMTYIPIRPLIAYKCLSCIFDYALAGIVGIIVYKITTDNRKVKAIIAYACVIFSPVVFLNSAAWAQCDVIYTFFVILAFFLLCSDHYTISFIFLGVAFAFKLQAIFAVPFWGLIYALKKRFSIVNFLWIPLTMEFLSIPALLVGREGGLLATFKIYIHQISEQPMLYRNYPSFWALISSSSAEEGYTLLSKTAVITTLFLLILLISIWIWENPKAGFQNSLYFLFLLSYTCVLFLPAMHERYGYLYEILGIIIAVVNKKMRVPVLILTGITLFTYGHCLFGSGIDIVKLAVVNCLTYIACVFVLTKDILCNREET